MSKVAIQHNGWREVKLGEVAEITMGQSPKSETYNESRVGLPFYQGVVDFGDRFVTPRVYCSAPHKVIQADDILLSVRAPVGRVNFTKEKCSVGRGNAGLRMKNGPQNFLFYLLKFCEDRFHSNSAGTVFSSINKSNIENLEVLLPPLPEQKSIAEVLSSLDDKIDLLHRQNKTLEDMAQALFRKWFVEEADKAWEEKPLDKIADYLNGLACQKFPPKNETDSLPVLKIKELRNGIGANSDRVTSEVKSKYMVERGDIIFSWSGSLMVKLWDGGKCVLNQHLFKVSSAQYPKWYIYLWTKHHIDKFVQIAKSKATTMGHIKRSDLSNSTVLIPTSEQLSEMSGIVSPLLEKMTLNFKQTRALKNLRDTLMPDLMCGVIQV